MNRIEQNWVQSKDNFTIYSRIESIGRREKKLKVKLKEKEKGIEIWKSGGRRKRKKLGLGGFYLFLGLVRETTAFCGKINVFGFRERNKREKERYMKRKRIEMWVRYIWDSGLWVDSESSWFWDCEYRCIYTWHFLSGFIYFLNIIKYIFLLLFMS